MATASGFPIVHQRGIVRHVHHRHGGLHEFALGCAISGLVLVCLGDPLHADLFEAAPVSATASVRASEATTTATPIEGEIATLESGLAKADAALRSSDGRVLDESVRTTLAARIAGAEQWVRDTLLLTAVGDPGALPDAGASMTGDRRELTSGLKEGISAVTAAVTAWEAEQARIAAEQEAARRAAEAAAAARVQPRTRTAGAAVVAGPYVEGIWTSGGQAEIDACRGSVNMADVAGYLGGDFYAAEHWSCGGRSWAGLGTGALVSFPGYGIYQVAGRVGGLPSGSSAASLPPGYDGYYQTCMNGDVNNLNVWLLTRVG